MASSKDGTFGAPRVHRGPAVQPLLPAQYAGAGARLVVLAPRGFDWPIADRKQCGGEIARRDCRGKRFADGDPLARRPPAWAVRPAAPSPAAAGLVQLLFAVAGLGLGLLLPRITAEPTVASSRVTEAPDRSGLRRPGTGQHHLLAAVPGRAMGLLQPVAPAEPIPRRPHRVADVRAGHRHFRVLRHRGPGHRQRPQGVSDRAGRGSGRSARRARPDPDPAGEGLRLHPAGADPFGHRRPGPQHP